MKHPESELQRACVRWFKFQYAHELLAAIPNGGKRSAIEAAIQQGEGVISGMPDLMLFRAKGQYHGLGIEMKAPGGKLTDAQAQVHQALLLRDYKVVTCNSFDSFKKEVDSYLNLKDETV